MGRLPTLLGGVLRGVGDACAQKILDEEGRELRPARDPGLGVDPCQLRPDRALGRARAARRSRHVKALQRQEGTSLLRGQRPAVNWRSITSTGPPRDLQRLILGPQQLDVRRSEKRRRKDQGPARPSPGPRK